ARRNKSLVNGYIPKRPKAWRPGCPNCSRPASSWSALAAAPRRRISRRSARWWRNGIAATSFRKMKFAAARIMYRTVSHIDPLGEKTMLRTCTLLLAGLALVSRPISVHAQDDECRTLVLDAM